MPLITVPHANCEICIAVMTGATFVTEQLGLTLEQVTMPTQCGAQFNAQFLRNPCAIF